MQELFVDTPDQLTALCEQLRSSRWLALDTEFIREKTYYPRLCLLQLCNGTIAACVDPLRIESLDPLPELLFDPDIVKVFHAGRQDLEIFHHLWNELPTPLFDTQPAAALLGLGDQIGYANLVQQLLGRQLDKGHTRTDWSRRPLEPAQQRYAFDDVIFLGTIYEQLEQKLRRRGRADWLREDFELLADPATYVSEPTAAWQRIKGRQKLKPAQLAILQAVAAWRETEARRSDRPRGWILRDDVLLELARRQPANREQMERIRGLGEGPLRRWGTVLLETISDARRQPESLWPREADYRSPLTTQQEALTDLLMCSLRVLAEHNDLTPSALATRRDLERLVCGDYKIELMQGWRRELAGNTLCAVLDGKMVPRVRERQIALVSAG